MAIFKRMTTIAYIGFPGHELDYKWMNYFAEKTEDYKVIIICSREESIYHLTSDKISIHPILPGFFPMKNLFHRRAIYNAAREILDSYKVDIIHCLYAIPKGLWGDMLKNNEKLIISTRGSDVLIQMDKLKNGKGIMDKVQNSILHKFYIDSLKNADAITSTSIRQKKKVEKETKRNDVSIVRTGNDVQKWLDALDNCERSYPKDEYVIFSPRISSTFYNTDKILYAFNGLVKKYPKQKFRLIIINYLNSDFDAFLQSETKRLKLEEIVTFVPRQPYFEMAKLFKTCDLVVSIPSNDGTPNSVIEAHLAKKPAIVGALEYDEDLFNDKTVWKIDSFTEKSLASKIVEVFEIDETQLNSKLDYAYDNSKSIIALSVQHKLLEGIYKKVLRKK